MPLEKPTCFESSKIQANLILKIATYLHPLELCVLLRVNKAWAKLLISHPEAWGHYFSSDKRTQQQYLQAIGLQESVKPNIKNLIKIIKGNTHWFYHFPPKGTAQEYSKIMVLEYVNRRGVPPLRFYRDGRTMTFSEAYAKPKSNHPEHINNAHTYLMSIQRIFSLTFLHRDSHRTVLRYKKPSATTLKQINNRISAYSHYQNISSVFYGHLKTMYTNPADQRRIIKTFTARDQAFHVSFLAAFPGCLEHAPEAFKKSLGKDPDFMLQAASENAITLNIAQKKFLADKAFMLQAIQRNHEAHQWIKSPLNANAKFMEEASYIYPGCIKHASQDIKKNKAMALRVLCTYKRTEDMCLFARSLDLTLRKNPAFMLEICKINVYLFGISSMHHTKHQVSFGNKLYQAGIYPWQHTNVPTLFSRTYHSAVQRLFTTASLMERAYQADISALEMCPLNLLKNTDFVKKATSYHPDAQAMLEKRATLSGLTLPTTVESAAQADPMQTEEDASSDQSTPMDIDTGTDTVTGNVTPVTASTSGIFSPFSQTLLEPMRLPIRSLLPSFKL